MSSSKKIPKDEKCLLIGFSMGGIISRHYLQYFGGIQRVTKFISIASPHQGTVLSYLLPLKGNLQMRPGSSYLKALNKQIESIASVAPVSIWSRYDQMIVPQSSAIMCIGESIHVALFPHKRLATSNAVSKKLLNMIL